MDANSLHNKVSVPREYSDEQRKSEYEHARRSMAYDLMSFLDKQKSRSGIEIKERVYSEIGLFGTLEYVFEIWVDVFDINSRRVTLEDSKLFEYDPTTKTIFGKIDDYLRKVTRARKYHWGM